MLKVLAVLAALWLSAPSASALGDGAGVAGRVVDDLTGAPVAGARVSVGALETQTDQEGAFRLGLATGPALLTVAAPGYARKTVPVKAGDGARVDVRLTATLRLQEQVEVTARAPAGGASPAAVPVPPTQVLKVAGAADNVFRVLQALPGVAATQEFSSRISVRGGGPDENLTVMDGIEISNPYRLQGLVSAFNPELIDSFTLDSGAFDVSHGDRLSSLLTVENRAGNATRAVAGSAALSLTDGNAILEGKLPAGAKGSWILTGRRTYYDLVADKIVGTQLPAFDDLQAKVVWEPRSGSRVSLFGLRSRESADASLNGDTPGSHGDLLDAARNDLAAATFESHLGPRLTTRTIAAWYENTESFDVTAQFQDKDLRSDAPDDSGIGQRNIAFNRDLSVRDVSVRQELTLQAGANQLIEAGAETHRLTTSVGWRISGNRNTESANGSSLRGGSGLPGTLNSSVASGRSGAWLQDRMQVGARLVLEAGLRLDHSEVNARTDLSPRLSATLGLGARTRLRGAVGKYTQSPGYDKLVQSDYFVDLSHAGVLALPNERSLHYSLALERDLLPGLQLRAEAYSKTFDSLTIGQLETEAEREARVAQYDFPADLQWSVPTAPQITSNPVANGRGSARGFDLFLAKKATSADTRLTGWVSYTYGRATREAYGRSYPFDYDRRHALSVVDDLRLGDRFDLSTTLRVATGFPRTPAIGVRVAAVPDPSDPTGTRLVPARDAAGRLMYSVDRGGVSNLNSGRLPLFARLDLRATYSPRGRSGRWLFYIDVINVLNRKNAGNIDTTLAYDPTSPRPMLVNHPGGSIPRLPSFGIRFRF